MWRFLPIHNRRGTIHPLIPQALSGLAALAAIGAMAVQTEIETVDRDMVFRFLTYTVGALVIVVWWLVRRMYEDQKKRVDRLNERLDELRVAVAELKVVYPYAPVHPGTDISRRPPQGEHQDVPHGDVTR